MYTIEQHKLIYHFTVRKNKKHKSCKMSKTTNVLYQMNCTIINSKNVALIKQK